MADIHFECVNCGQQLEVEEDAAGMSVECPSCNQQITIPEPAPSEPLPEKPKLRLKDQGSSSLATSVSAATSQDEHDTSLAAGDLPQEIHSATCSNCGAQLDIDGDTSTATCLFCGSKSLVSTPQDRVNRLRDLENSSPRTAHIKPSISFDQARAIIIQRVKADDCGLKNADQLQIDAKGFYHPAWRIDVEGLAYWNGEDSRQVEYTDYKTTYETVGNRQVEKTTPYKAYRTEWDRKSGQQPFTATLLFPAAEGISTTQFEVISNGAGSPSQFGKPTHSRQFMVIPATKPQARVWNEYDANSLVHMHAESACVGCADRITRVSVTLQSRTFSLTYIPVAVLTYTANETDYRHFVNLQTGQFSGDVPLDIMKVANEAALAKKTDQELGLSRILGRSALGAYVLVTCLLNMAWRYWEPIDAAKSIAVQPFLAFFGENLKRGDLLAGSRFLSLVFSWAGWLIAYGIYKVLVPSGSPWLSFVSRRQAFLLRLLLNPPKQIANVSISTKSDASPRRNGKERSAADAVDGMTLEELQFLAEPLGIQKAADANELDSMHFELAKHITLPVGRKLAFIGDSINATSRFIGTMIAIGCGCAALLIGTVGYYQTVKGIQRAEIRARLAHERQEQLDREEKARQEQRAREEIARQERALRAQRERDEAEYRQRVESARQMLSQTRWHENAHGLSYLPPDGWRRSRGAANSMSSWLGSGTIGQPKIDVLLVTNHGSSLERAAESGLSTIEEHYREVGGRVESQGTVRFYTSDGRDGIRLLVDIVTRAGPARQAVYYIDNGPERFLGICSAPRHRWNNYAMMFDASMQTVRFDSMRSRSYDAADNTPEINANMRNSDVLLDIGFTYYYDGNHHKAYTFFKKAAEAGNVVAKYNVGSCYMDGVGVEQDVNEAIKWYRLAGRRGNADAQVRLGLCYFRGVGVRKDLDLAEECFQLAAQQGHQDGRRLLNELRRDRSADERAQVFQQQEPQLTDQPQHRDTRQTSPPFVDRSPRATSSGSRSGVRGIGDSDRSIRRIGESDRSIRRIGE